MNRRDENNKIINDLDTCINLLHITTCETDRNSILDHMRCKVYDLYLINNLEEKTKQQQPLNQVSDMLPVQNPRNFTKEELAYYNGKNNKPAYVAVNGIVYDVTNNAAWAAATHFGYSAGQDLTAQYNSCHGGERILEKLPVVGKLIE